MWRVIAVALAAGCVTPPEQTGPETIGDPAGPLASGSLTLAPGSTTNRYTVIAIRLIAIDPVALELTNDRDLPTEFPYDFVASGGFGGCPDIATSWQVRAWLAADYHETAPLAGAPHAELPLAVESCPHATGLTMELHP